MNVVVAAYLQLAVYVHKVIIVQVLDLVLVNGALCMVTEKVMF